MQLSPHWAQASAKAPCSGTRKHFGVDFINRSFRASK